jgi:hypothetical protein
MKIDIVTIDAEPGYPMILGDGMRGHAVSPVP